MSETEQWIRPGQGKVIAFVHGIGAKSALDYWLPFLQVVQTDEKLQDFGLFVWKYPTHLEPGLWRNLLGSLKGATLRESIPRIKVLGGVWNTTYQAQFAEYHDVILICHSMGGLVVKSWIIDTLQKGQSQQLDTVRHISFYATPHEGAPVTTLASWNKQLKDMQLDSPFIEEVGQRWYEHVVSWKEKPLDVSARLYNRYLPHVVIAGANDNVVPLRSASIRGMDTTLVVGDHSQVIQPQDASDTRYKAWREDMQKALQAGQPSIPPSGQAPQFTKNTPQLGTSVGSDVRKALTVFFSYAAEDETLTKELEKQLVLLRRQGRITGWFSRNVGAGEETEEEIVAHLNQAQIILLLISPDFLASEQYWNTEVLLAMQKHETKEARVIPILLRPTDDWKSAPFGKLQALPRNERPVTSWPVQDEALTNIVQGIKLAISELSPPASLEKASQIATIATNALFDEHYSAQLTASEDSLLLLRKQVRQREINEQLNRLLAQAYAINGSLKNLQQQFDDGDLDITQYKKMEAKQRRQWGEILLKVRNVLKGYDANLDATMQDAISGGQDEPELMDQLAQVAQQRELAQALIESLIRHNGSFLSWLIEVGKQLIMIAD